MEIRESAGLAIVYNSMILLAETAGRKDSRSWGIPKGGIETGESKIDAAIRETREELGIKVPRKLVKGPEYQLVVNARNYGYYKHIYYFVVEIKDLSEIGLTSLEVPKKQLDLTEISGARFMSRSEGLQSIMISQQKIFSDITILESLTIDGMDVEPNQEPNPAQKGETEDDRLHNIRRFKGKIKDFESYWNDRINQKGN